MSVNTVKVTQPLDDGNPFALYTIAGDYIWISGQVALNESGAVIGANDIETQARTIFEKIDVILKNMDADFSDVACLHTWFTIPLDAETARRYWKVRREFFGDSPPASTGVQVAALVHPDLLLEIEAIVFKPQSITR